MATHILSHKHAPTHTQTHIHTRVIHYMLNVKLLIINFFIEKNANIKTKRIYLFYMARYIDHKEAH